MAQVPYNPVPSPAPQDIATPRVSEATPGAAFGETIGQALSGLGRTMEVGSGELFQRAVALQDLRNETAAREGDAQYSMLQSKMHADFSALQGKARVDALNDYIQSSNELRTQIRANLPNDAARRMYDATSLSFMNRNIFNAAGAAATANKEWQINVATAGMDIDAKTMADNPNDEHLYQQKKDALRRDVGSIADAKGFEPGGIEEKDLFMKQSSKLMLQRVVGMSRTQPFSARTFLDEHKGELTEQDYLTADQVVTTKSDAVGSVNIANSVYDPKKTLADMEQDAQDEARKMQPDNPLLAKKAVDALHAKYNQDKFAERQQVDTDRQTVADGISKGVKNEQELLAMPGMDAAIARLPATTRNDISGMINRFNAARDKEGNEENYRRLSGMANNNVGQFLDVDLTKENLSQAQMDKLFAKRRQLMLHPGDDPRVSNALRDLKGAIPDQLEALKIYNRKGNEDQYDHFVGSLESALDLWQQDHGKPAGYHDIVDTIAPQLLKNHSVPGFFSIWGHGLHTQQPFFEQDTSSDAYQKFSNTWSQDIEAKTGVKPTDTEIYRAYIRDQLKTLYPTKAKPSGGPAIAD